MEHLGNHPQNRMSHRFQEKFKRTFLAHGANLAMHGGPDCQICFVFAGYSSYWTQLGLEIMCFTCENNIFEISGSDISECVF